uniref:Uncharacterized protein n=1 Tax=Arundo donax TaxID=35708 RepID=A0A0A9AGS2_ARUDO
MPKSYFSREFLAIRMVALLN